MDESLPAAEFMYNSVRSENLQAIRFKVDLGWNPRGPWEVGSLVASSAENVAQFNLRLNEALRDARFSYQLENARNTSYAAQKLTVPSYNVGDRVLPSLSTFKDAVYKSQSSDKLRSKRFGPFTSV